MNESYFKMINTYLIKKKTFKRVKTKKKKKNLKINKIIKNKIKQNKK